jgi:hypothetical protein
MAQCEQLSSVGTGYSIANLRATIWIWGLPGEERVLPIQPWWSIVLSLIQSRHFITWLFYCENYEASNEIWEVYYEWQTGKDVVGSNYHTCKVATYSIMRWHVCSTHVSLYKPDCLLQSAGISYNDPWPLPFRFFPIYLQQSSHHSTLYTYTHKHIHAHTRTQTHTTKPTNQTSRISWRKETPELLTKFTVSELSSMNKVHFFFFRLYE